MSSRFLWRQYAYPIGWGALALLIAVCLGEVLLPLVCAFFLAYLLHPVVKVLQSWKLSHRAAVGLTFIVALIVIIGLLYLLTPRLIHLGVAILKDFPNMMTKVLSNIESLAHYFNIPFHIEADAVAQEMYSFLNTMSFSTLASLSGFFQKTVFNLIQVAIWFVRLCIFPLFFYYALDRFEVTMQEIISFFPQRFHWYIDEFSSIVDQVLSGYIRGQLVVCSLMAILYATGFYFAGMSYGIIIGVMTGFSYIIPYVGIGVASLFGLTITLAHYSNFSSLIWILSIYGVGQALESFILTPRITGNKVGLDPFITILALMVGANLIGFLGVLTAIPIAGILKQYYTRIKAHYRTSDFFVKE